MWNEGFSIPIELRSSGDNLEALLRFLQRKLANKFSHIWRFEEGTVAVFTRDKLMLRNSQTLTVTITVEYRRGWNELVITIMASGGREGFFRLDFWGAENAAENWAVKEIKKALVQIDGGAQTRLKTPSSRPME